MPRSAPAAFRAASARRVLLRLVSRAAFRALPAACAILAACAGCAKRAQTEIVEWTSMGTVASFRCRDAEDLRLASGAMAVFKDVEALLSAHDPGSELSRLAPLPDGEVLARCSPLVRPCYEAAFGFRDATGGAFNPRYRGEGTMDLGAIAKGFALDLAAERLAGRDALLDLGGNLKACGGEWRAGVLGGADGDFILLTNGMACATSGEYFRGRHIRDGRTGGEISGTVRSVTVVHPSSAQTADALSTILFILGREKGDAFLREHHPEARAIWL